jgi:tetratricopeptide (TPR) repeat protein
MTEPMFGWSLAILVIAGILLILLRNLVFHSPELRVRRKGLDSLIAGRPEKAEKYFRKSLAMLDPSDRVRPLVCLGDALMDQGRYQEARECLEMALELGDPTGSGQGSMADLLLLTRAKPEMALEMADQAVHLSTGKMGSDIYFGGEVTNDLRRARYWARTAQALAQLERPVEAQQAIDRALRIVDAAKAEAEQKTPRTSFLTRLILGGGRLGNHRDLQMASAHWKIGLALLAIDDRSRASDHFRVTRDTDRRGKYRRLAQQQLDSSG